MKVIIVQMLLYVTVKIQCIIIHNDSMCVGGWVGG